MLGTRSEERTRDIQYRYAYAYMLILERQTDTQVGVSQLKPGIVINPEKLIALSVIEKR